MIKKYFTEKKYIKVLFLSLMPFFIVSCSESNLENTNPENTNPEKTVTENITVTGNIGHTVTENITVNEKITVTESLKPLIGLKGQDTTMDNLTAEKDEATFIDLSANITCGSTPLNAPITNTYDSKEYTLSMKKGPSASYYILRYFR